MWDVQSEPDESPELKRFRRVDGELSQWNLDESEEARRKARFSQYGHALNSVTNSALELAREHGFPEDGPYNLERLLIESVELTSGIRFATMPYTGGTQDGAKLEFWTHRFDPLGEVQRKTVPHLDRIEIEGVVGEYLKAGLRSQFLDRTLTDLLIAIELYSFADEMINEVPTIIAPPRSPLKQTHPAVAYLRGQWQSFCLWAVVGFVAFLLGKNHIISSEWMIGVIVVALGLFLLGMALATLATPFAWAEHAKKVKNVRNLMLEMDMTYRELRSDGPVSARHLLERIKKADEAGVLWPGPLYALLDDVIARKGWL